jgi:hypothetical protein
MRMRLVDWSLPIERALALRKGVQGDRPELDPPGSLTLPGPAPSRVLGFAGPLIVVCLFALALLCYAQAMRGDQSQGGLVVDPRVHPLGQLQAGKIVPMTVTMTNRSARPVRLLGAHDVCATWGCLLGRGLPMDIPAGANRQVQIDVRPHPRGFSGEFTGEIVFYSDCPGAEQIPVRVAGRIQSQ